MAQQRTYALEYAFYHWQMNGPHVVIVLVSVDGCRLCTWRDACGVTCVVMCAL